jgi:hypothetical protein
MPLAEFQESAEVERRVIGLRQRLADLRGMLGIRQDFELPRLAGETDFPPSFFGQLVRDRLASGNVAEICRGCQIRLELGQRFRQFRRRRIRPPRLIHKSESGAGHSQLQQAPTRD